MIDFLRNITKSAEEKRQERLNAYLDDALSAQERSQFEQELAQDAALRGDLEQLRWVKFSVRKLPRVRAPRNFVLDPAVYGQKQSSPAAWNLYPGLRVATALTAFFFILALALDVATPYGALRQPLTGSSAPQSIAEESLEETGDAFMTAEADVASEASGEEATGSDGAAEMMPFAVTAEGEADLAVEEAAEEMAAEVAQDEAVPAEEPVEEAVEEPAADRLLEEPQTDLSPAPGAAVPTERGDGAGKATSTPETAALAPPEATPQLESETAPLIIATATSPAVAGSETAGATQTEPAPAPFPFLLAIEIVLAVAFVALGAATILMRRIT